MTLYHTVDAREGACTGANNYILQQWAMQIAYLRLESSICFTSLGILALRTANDFEFRATPFIFDDSECWQQL